MTIKTKVLHIKLLQLIIINNIKLIDHMPRGESQIVGISTLQHIINNGTKLAKDNQTIKKHLFTFSNRNHLCITNELVLQSGAKNQLTITEKIEEDAPQNIRKDQRCHNSVNISPSKKNTGRQSLFEKFGKDTAITRSPRLSRRSSAQTNRKTTTRNREDRRDNKFVDLSDILEPPTGRILTQGIRNENKMIEQLRQKHEQQEKLKKHEELLNLKKQKEQQQRIFSLKSKLEKHMKQKDHNFSFDTDGNYIFFDTGKQHVSLRKKYPPSNLQFEFEQQEEPDIQQHNPVHIKQKAARGQAFASAVLKTMNMSKFSLNFTSKTCNIDEFAFMKRNDLFNNNHSRQVTTIPYLQVSEGTNYTETHTNLSVGKKTQRTAHSENKSKFKTHQMQLRDNTEKHNNKTEILNVDLENIQIEKEKRRIQSSRPYMRPKTSYAPKTAKTADRITSVNQQLVCELIE